MATVWAKILSKSYILCILLTTYRKREMEKMKKKTNEAIL